MRSFFVFAARGMLLNKLSFAGTEELLHRFTRFVLTVLLLNAFAGCSDLTHRCRRRRCAVCSARLFFTSPLLRCLSVL